MRSCCTFGHEVMNFYLLMTETPFKSKRRSLCGPLECPCTIVKSIRIAWFRNKSLSQYFSTTLRPVGTRPGSSLSTKASTVPTVFKQSIMSDTTPEKMSFLKRRGRIQSSNRRLSCESLSFEQKRRASSNEQCPGAKIKANVTAQKLDWNCTCRLFASAIVLTAFASM